MKNLLIVSSFIVSLTVANAAETIYDDYKLLADGITIVNDKVILNNNNIDKNREAIESLSNKFLNIKEAKCGCNSTNSLLDRDVKNKLQKIIKEK